MTLSPRDEEPLSSEDGKYYFESIAVAEGMFANSLTKNLKETERLLGVSLTMRDHWIKVQTSAQKDSSRAFAFLTALNKQYLAFSRPLDQREFELILSAFAENHEKELQNFFSERIKVSPRKHEIVPRTRNQLSYIRNMREKDIVFGIGPAGTGKTYLAMAMAVSLLLAKKYDRIILTRPAVEAGENLGFLPGKLEEKINPYLRPLYDALYDMLDFSEAEALIDRNIIEVAPMAFMRGRTLNNAFVILDEAQNATHEQMLMFLTRLGFHSQCVVCGDPTQTDLPRGKSSGLTEAIRKLQGIDEIGISQLTSRDVVRHSLVEKIINAYQVPDKDEVQ